jgi:hypothetical protein
MLNRLNSIGQNLLFFANKNYVLKDNLHTGKKITKSASVEFPVFGKIRQTVEIKVLSNEN